MWAAGQGWGDLLWGFGVRDCVLRRVELKRCSGRRGGGGEGGAGWVVHALHLALVRRLRATVTGYRLQVRGARCTAGALGHMINRSLVAKLIQLRAGTREAVRY